MGEEARSNQNEVKTRYKMEWSVVVETQADKVQYSLGDSKQKAQWR